MANYLKPVAAVLVPNIGGFLSGYFTRSEVRPTTTGQLTWYQALKKPSFQPPNWIFAPVWTTLYSTMGYASYMIFRDGGGFGGKAALPLAVYGAHLALNFAWSPLFFKAHNLGLAFAGIVALWGSVVATIVSFHGVNVNAAYIMLPYLGWVSFASFLNFTLWRMNKDRTD
ncbi:translocator protein-like [Dreissena polymorpha]|uniref:translocator protein-like n=1 Tax=Dreissena polymorpha TaxID=45954 RepID=UPI002263F4EE|nr:translocator protein-like [Dreissena polymorpha]